MERGPLANILELPLPERVEIAQQIWDSVAEYPDAVVLTDAQRDELERRWKSYQDAPEAGESWEAVKASLRDE